MIVRDILDFSLAAFRSKILQSALTALGITIGIASVVLLTSIGEGLNRFVLSEFTQFGTNLIGINPGKVRTMGTPLGILGTVRPLTISDAMALRKLHQVLAVVPLVQGNADVEWGGRKRRITVYGVGPKMPYAFRMNVASGNFLPMDDPESPRAFAVLGSKLRSELFKEQNPLGERIRIGGSQFRVMGSMESKGQILGFDMDDTVFIPAQRALELFNRVGLHEIDVLFSENATPDEVAAGIKRLLMNRHGQEDFTITTQQQMLDVLGSVLDMLTIAVGALGGISLFVGSVGIFTIMTIMVAERKVEIGLMSAIGATKGQILLLFLSEAVLISAIGGVGGLIIGAGGALFLHAIFPVLPVKIYFPYVVIAELVSVFIGLVSGIIPARRASRLLPVEALREE